jgi:glycosyltransferase involved in cell wall biosynthesis
MNVGYEGIRIPPSIQTSLMRFDEVADPDIARFQPLTQLPERLRMKQPKRIQAGDPRIGERVIDGFDEHGEPTKETIIIAEGSIDPDEPVQVTNDIQLQTECVVLHHDPSSISRNYTNFTKTGRPEGVAYVGITVWEPDSIPHAVARIMSELDAVVVPSEHTRRAFLRSGLETECVVVPHTFDPETWIEPSFEGVDRERDNYVFYAIGTSIARKNLETLCAAFFTAFEGRDDVVLRLKGSGDFAEIAATAKKGFGRVKVDPARRPPMRIYCDKWSVDKMRAFHLDGDCFVSATRGEGFGLCEFEAKLCASRVITTGWGAAPEFLIEENKQMADILVPYELAPVGGMYGIGCYDPKQKWAEPDFDALVESLRRAERERLGPDVFAWNRLHNSHGPKTVGNALAAVLHDARAEAKEDAEDEFTGTAQAAD